MPATILFDVTRTGPDLSRAVSVDWVLQGGLVDADLATGQAKSGRLSWAANETAAKLITIQTTGNTTDNPDKICQITLSNPLPATDATIGSATAFTTILDDDVPVSVGEACTNPRLGPIRSAPKHVILYHHNRPLTAASYRNLLPVADLMTKIIYTGLDFGTVHVHDHRQSEIKKYAAAMWKFYTDLRNDEPQARMMWWDWEKSTCDTDTSVNIPASVTANWTMPYLASRDTYHAAYYETGVWPGFSCFNVTDAHANELRIEAARYSSELAREICAIADAAGGVPGFEQMSYTHPDQFSRGMTWAQQAAHINKVWMCPWMVGGGHPLYFSGPVDELEQFKNTPTHWTDRFAANIRGMRGAFGAKFKIIPTIWARWYVQSADNNVLSNFPNNSICVPAGFIKTVVEAAFGAGADGLTVYGSGDVSNASGSLAADFNARYGELADYMTQHRSEFVGVRY
jgi:hypothetical protein